MEVIDMRNISVWLLILLSSLGNGQLGATTEPIRAALEPFSLREKDTNSYVSAQRDTVTFVYEKGIFNELQGKVTLLNEGAQLLATAVAYATSYEADEVIEGLQDFLESEDIERLAGEGPRSLELGPEYLLTLEVSQGFEREYIVQYRLSSVRPFVVDESAFPVAQHRLGAEDASYVVREFSDFQCPYCGQFATNGLPLIKDVLLARDDVRFEFHHFPLKSIHPNAAPASEATLCVVEANDEAAFWAYHDILFERQKAWSGLGDPYPYFARLAKEIGLSNQGVLACLQEGRFIEAVEEAFNSAVQVGARGTPTIFVNGYRLRGNYADVEGYLELFALVDAQASTTMDAEETVGDSVEEAEEVKDTENSESTEETSSFWKPATTND